jgi:hypothetical protein
MDGALQGVNGFALGEQGMNCAPIPFVGQIIAKVDCAYERADRGAGFVYGVALCRAAEAFDQPACTAPAMLQRRSHTQKFVVASRNRGWRNGAPGDLGQCFGHGKATWKVKLTIGSAGRAHAQADAKGFADSCSEVGIAMRVDRETLDAGMPQGPLDRRTGLSGAQQDRLIIRDSPLVEHMGVGADRCRFASWIEAGGPQFAARLDTHHVAGGGDALAPDLCDGQAAEMAENSVIGRTQSAFAMIRAMFKPPDHRPDRVGCEARHHPRHVSHAEIRTQRKQGGVEGNQFGITARSPSKRRMAEAGHTIGFDENVGELRLIDPAKDLATERASGRILDVGLDLGDDKMPILDPDIACLHGLCQHHKPCAQPFTQADQRTLGTSQQS